VCGVGTDVASLVIAVNYKIQSHQFMEILVGEAKHLCKVAGLIQAVIGGNEFSVVVGVAVDLGSNARQEGDEIQSVLVHVVPVFGLRNTIVIGLGKAAFGLKGGNTNDELGHGVKMFREAL